MKKLLPTIACLCFLSLTTFASNSFYSKLVTVNSQWQKQNDIPAYLKETTVCENKPYTEWIATHLMLVEEMLRGRSTAGLSASQKLNRQQRLNELHDYRLAGSFPINDYKGFKTPVFIDRKGTHCAVGQLMMTSGRDDLAQQIDREQKFAYVHEIKVAGVKEWAAENGFTVDELAWIQPAYWPLIECYDDVIYVGSNTLTVCPIFKNDLIGEGQCGQSPYPLNTTVVSQPAHGTVFQLNDTTFRYQPNTSYTGKDSFTYAVASMPNFCLDRTDTAKVILNVLAQAGTFVSFAPGDADYNGELNSLDVLSLVKNLGETDAARLLNLPGCEVTYSAPWGTTFNGNDIAPSDGDGNGQVDASDLAYITDCFNGYKQGIMQYQPNQLYEINVLDYDTVIAPGKSVDVKFTVVDTNGTVIPLKAITLVNNPRQNAVSFLNSNLKCSALSGSIPGSLEASYEKLTPGFSPQLYMGAFSYRQLSNPAKDVSVASDTFQITTAPISADSIKYAGVTYISMNQVWVLDTNDNIFMVNYEYIPFRTTQLSGIEKIQIDGLSVFPNPAVTELNLNLNGRQADKVRTFSTDGKLVSEVIQPLNNRIDIQTLVKGVYIAEVTVRGETQRIRWVKM